MWPSSPMLTTLGNLLYSFTSHRVNLYRHTGVFRCFTVTLLFIYALTVIPDILLPTFFYALLTLLFWQVVFLRTVTSAIPDPYTILYAMLFSLLLPINVSPWILLLCVSFGSIFGERVFGGRGFAFLHPVSVGLAFYLFSSSIELNSTAANLVPIGWVAIVAIALMLLELVSWRTLLGVAIGLLLAAQLTNLQNLPVLITSSSILIILTLLAGDPGSGGSTNQSRWMHGALCGSLLVLIYGQTGLPMHATVFAVLLASLSAPLLDYFAVLTNTSRRKHRHE